MIDGSEVSSATVAGTAELTSVVLCSTRTEPPLVGDASPAWTFDVAWTHRAVQRLIMVVMLARLVNHLTQWGCGARPQLHRLRIKRGDP
jgi:hypothetical protein